MKPSVHEPVAVGPAAPSHDVRAADADRPNLRDGDAGDTSFTPIGTRAAGGVAWLFSYLVTTRAVYVASQVALGWLLAPEDFGVYAVAVSLTLVTRALQDGGVPQLLIQRGTARYRDLAVDMFWLALTANVIVGAGLVLASPLLVDVFDEPRLQPLLWIMAGAMPLSTPWALLSAKLQLESRWREWALIKGVSSSVEYALIVTFAWMGYGPASFVLPLPLSAVLAGGLAWLVCRDAPWLRRPDPRHWPPLLSDARWLMFGAITAGMFAQGDYLVLGRIAPAAVVGIYYFAYQIPAQFGHLAGSIGGVLFPMLGQLGERDRRARALLRGLRAQMLVIAPGCVAVAVLFPQLEQLIWAGRWSAAVVPVQVLSILMPFRLMYPITEAGLLASGAFRTWSNIMLLEGIGLMTTAWFGATIAADATVVAITTGVYLALSVIAVTTFALRQYGATVRQVLAGLAVPWLLAVCAGLGGVWTGRAVNTDTFGRLMIEGGVFVVAYGLLVRGLCAQSLNELRATLPARWQRLNWRIRRVRGSHWAAKARATQERR